MATLNFKGKSAVWNHHLSVPYHTLDKDKSSSLSGVDESENLVIEGDNLLALKALLPKYQEKVKCIYIDPPYNTGKEGWAYNDNVNNPIIKSWIGETVGKEGDDLLRHDKWLCMMTPRLKLLRELLSEDGVIFVSIDDNEIHNLRSVMNEIFGSSNFVANFIRQSIKGGTGPTDEVRKTHDYVLVFAKNKEESELSGLEIDSEPLDLVDEKGSYRKGRELNKWGASSRREDSPSMWFSIHGPNGVDVFPIRNDNTEGRWRWGKKKLLKAVESGDVIFESRGDGTFIVYEKVRSTSPRRKSFSTLDLPNADGTKAIKELFDNKIPFDYPKPPELVKFLISLCANEDNDIILDSFAGSGTTAQAVLELNQQEDEVHRNFILIQLPETLSEKAQAKSAGYEYVHEITRDRVKKVIKRDKLDVGFTYYRLGPSIDGRSILEGRALPTWGDFAKYVHYLATGKPIDEVKKPNKTWEVISKTKHTGVYLIYKDNVEDLRKLAITRDWMETVKDTEGRKIVYAPACFLDKEILDEHNISFVQIPFNLFQRN